MIFGRRKNRKADKIPNELIEIWNRAIFANLGISQDTDIDTAMEASRVIILETSRFYDNLIRLKEGLKLIY